MESMFDRCFEEGNIKQAVGIALESRRLDKLEASSLLSLQVLEGP